MSAVGCCCHLRQLWCVQIIPGKNFSFKRTFFAELKVFHLKTDSKAFLNVILNDFCNQSLSLSA